jgi:hypothetical protein
LQEPAQQNSQFRKKLGEDGEEERQQEKELQSVLNERAQGRNVFVDWCLLPASHAVPVAEKEER